jgi:hypothetical protein
MTTKIEQQQQQQQQQTYKPYMTAGMFMQGAGLGMQAGAAYQAATAENLASRYTEMMSRRNAEIADMQAIEALKLGRQQEADFRRGVRSLRSSQRAAAAASGVLVSSGSVARVEASTIESGEVRAMRIRRSAQKENWALRMQALNYRLQAEQAHGMRRSPGIAMTSTILQGLGQMATSYAYSGMRYQGAQ